MEVNMEHNDLTAMLETAVEAARCAGALARREYPAERDVTVKGYRDIVTATDEAAERVILDLIAARFPAHTRISEEAGGVGLDDAYAWVVDPIDGTTNFARRMPNFTISIGLLARGRPLVGVVYDPMRDNLFSAARGRGAHLNGAPIRVSPTDAISDAVVALDWGHADAVRAQGLAYLNRIAPRCRTLRALGSAALAQAYVAAGWLDAYYNLGLKPWDAAAGMLLVAEAGGRYTTPQGTPYRADQPAALVSNGRLHAPLLALLAGA
jgi:myo-inositol-1(or 4)-monophosphatase